MRSNELMKKKDGVQKCTEATHPFTIKPIFSTLGSIVENLSNINGCQIVFTPNDSVRVLLGYKSKLIYEEKNLSDYPVDILSFDNIFLESDIARGKIFKGKRSGLIHNSTMDVDPGYKHIEKFRVNIQLFMILLQVQLSN